MSQSAQTADAARVRGEVLASLLAEARREPRVECCGLLAGRDGVITTVLPARNTLSSATAYEIAPAELFQMFRRMREQNLDHLGIYHSHPNTDSTPSPSDLDRSYYPDAAYFIISPRQNVAKPIRAFRIAEGVATELAIEEV